MRSSRDTRGRLKILLVLAESCNRENIWNGGKKPIFEFVSVRLSIYFYLFFFILNFFTSQLVEGS
jgi:hypothetical protein